MREGARFCIVAVRCIIALVLPVAWSSAQNKPALAEDVYKNIRLFKGMPAARVIPAMDALTGLLGVDCTYCHIVREWDRDDKPQKQTTRKMFEMMEYLNHEHLGGEEKISCWTCHRGHAQPPAPPENTKLAEQAKQWIPIGSADRSKPAAQVFRNIQSMKDSPAGDFPAIMAYFSRALGVECAHCHISGQWEKDTPAKQKARVMLAMVDATVHKFYGNEGPLGCPDCHQGSVKPQFQR